MRYTIKHDYEVSEDGRVFSYKSNRFLQGSINAYGYRVITYPGGCRYVHRMVAECFIPNPQNLPFVNHLDGNKLNNHVSNLEWCSNRDNMKHAWENGLMPIGEAHGQNKFSEAQITWVCEEISKGKSAGEISKTAEFNISRNRVLDIRARRTWKHISCKFEWATERATISRKA